MIHRGQLVLCDGTGGIVDPTKLIWNARFVRQSAVEEAARGSIKLRAVIGASRHVRRPGFPKKMNGDRH